MPATILVRESLRSLRRWGHRRTCTHGSSGRPLILRAAEAENWEENNSQQNQTNPKPHAFPKTLRQVNAKNYPDDEVYEGNQQQDNPPTRPANDLAQDV